MTLGVLFRWRLALRFYVVGLAQILAIAAGFFVILANTSPRKGFIDGQIALVAEYLAAGPAGGGALQARLDRVRQHLGLDLAVTGPSGEILGSTGPGPLSCGAPGGIASAPKGLVPDRECVARAVSFTDGQAGTVTLLLVPPPPPPLGTRVVPLVLLVVGVSSLLLTRSLTGSLRRMSDAARAFGGGDLSARAGLARRDELGDVARAFDEMAERVTALLRAEKELLANVSHELRTPLTRIRIALDIAAEGDAEAARQSLADITGDLDELERLVTDILTAAKLDLEDGEPPASSLPLRRQTVSVRDLLGQAATRFRAEHPERKLREAVEDRLPQVNGDPVLLRRVLDNLLENAHKYTDKPEAEISLAARTAGSGQDERLQISVEDSGIGIAGADLPKIFRPFFRADRSRTRATGGLGLGLALAKRIVEAHGGRIEVESRLHEGTRVRVELPAVRLVQ